jgi:hypothetical protein
MKASFGIPKPSYGAPDFFAISRQGRNRAARRNQPRSRAPGRPNLALGGVNGSAEMTL